MVVKSRRTIVAPTTWEPREKCTSIRFVVWCQHLNDLQGVITEDTAVLMLEDTRGLSEGKSLESPIENADKVGTLYITKNQDVDIEPQVLSIFSNLRLFGVTRSRWTLIKTGTFSGTFIF